MDEPCTAPVQDPARDRATPSVGAVTSLPDGGSPASTASLPASRAWTYASLAVVGAAADLWTKSAVFGWRGLPGQSDVWWLIDQHLGIETAVNIGAVFGVGAGKGNLFAGFSILAAVGILVWLFWFKAAQSWSLTWALGLVTGGILGNLHDRLGMWWQDGYPLQWQSGVRDWILVRVEGVPLLDPWPNFNIADSLLVVGACLLLYQSFFPCHEHGQGDAKSPDLPAGTPREPSHYPASERGR